jgi:hypothetical protein
MDLTELNTAVPQYPLDDLRMADFMASQRPTNAEKD